MAEVIIVTDSIACPEDARKLKERAQTEFNCVGPWITSFSPVMAYDTGRGVVGFAFYSKREG